MGVLFAERLKELRNKKGINQEELAKKFLLNKSSISRYENGKQLPEIDMIDKLADFFEVSLDYLMGKVDSNEPSEDPIEVFGKNTTDPFDVFNQGSTKDQFYYKVYDDSMEMAYLPEGSLALIKRQNHIDSQDIAVVELNGKILLRRFIKKNNVTVLEPESYNPKHELKIVTDGEDTLSIVGKVLSVKINFFK